MFNVVDYYQNLVKQSKTLSSRKQISDAATIEADVSRTFDANEIKPMTIDGIENVNALEVVRRVLYAMAIHGRERNGYVQGMNYLAANFIVVTRNEETSFWLTRSVTEILLKGYFDQELYQFQVDSKAFRSLVRLQQCLCACVCVWRATREADSRALIGRPERCAPSCSSASQNMTFRLTCLWRECSSVFFSKHSQKHRYVGCTDVCGSGGSRH